MAIETYKDPQGFHHPAAAVWSGSSWTNVAMPVPGGAEDEASVQSVSCASTISCAVIGSDNHEPVIERWNGTTWTVESYTSAYEGDEKFLPDFFGVTCSATLDCMIVGEVAMLKSGTVSLGALTENVEPTPGVVTEPATNITGTTATVNGIVAPEARETSYHFEYGRTATYETAVPVPNANAPGRSGTDAVSSGVAHLEPETTYHYRLVATNADGTTDGADRTFITGPASTYLGSFGSAGTGEGHISGARGLAVDAEGYTLVADAGNHRVDAFNAKGEYSKAIGVTGTEEEKLTEPQGVAVDREEKIWATDTGANRLVVYSERGGFLKAIGRFGGGLAKFDQPTGIAVGHGNVFVADSANNRIQKFNESGTFLGMAGYNVQDGGEDKFEICELLCRVGVAGSGPGQFNDPRGIAVGPNGRVYVADTGNDRIEIYNEHGEYQRAFGSAGTKPGQFEEPDGITVASNGDVLVVDSGNKRIQKCNESGECKVLIDPPTGQSGHLELPWGIQINSAGEVDVSDATASHIERFSLAEGP